MSPSAAKKTPIVTEVDYEKTNRGARTIVTWAGMKSPSRGKPYEAMEGGAAAIVIDGNLGGAATVIIRGSNDGTNFHPIIGRMRAGAFTIPAVPLFIDSEVWGDEATNVTVSVALGGAG